MKPFRPSVLMAVMLACLLLGLLIGGAWDEVRFIGVFLLGYVLGLFNRAAEEVIAEKE